MNGLILVEGSRSRLYPITRGVRKTACINISYANDLLALSALMLSGIKGIVIISNPENPSNCKNLFRNAEIK